MLNHTKHGNGKIGGIARKFRDLRYDSLDHENSSAAIEFLNNSLDLTLRRRLNTRMEPGDSFAMYWLRLMNMLVSHSSKHYDELRDQVRKCTPRSCSEENLEEMCESLRSSLDFYLGS